MKRKKKTHLFQISYHDKPTRIQAKDEIEWRVNSLKKRHQDETIYYRREPLKKSYLAIMTPNKKPRLW